MSTITLVRVMDEGGGFRPAEQHQSNNQPKGVRMHTQVKKIILSAIMAGCVSMAANASGTTGTHNGYFWTTYYTGSGTASYTGGSGGNFKGTWTSGVTDAIVGEGWSPGSVRTVNYNCGQLSGSWHTAGNYFWAPYPTHECYITDFGSNSGTYKGQVNSDGGTYNIYLGSQGGGSQWKDSRTSSQSLGANHTITMSNHVNKWNTLGWYLGTFNNGCVFMAEAFSGPGTVNATVW